MEDMVNEQKLKKSLENKSDFSVRTKRNLEIKTIKINEKDYPQQLKTIKNPPQQLYIKGNLQNLTEPGIAVVGSRNCSNYGRKICKKFTNNLVGYNINIISGLAIGIDTVAHKTCLESKGKTIAILPSGFNKIFPKENEKLFEKILEKDGTIVTEYPPDFEKTPESCRERNRIMSGLAIGTLVIEAEERSGTQITVRNTKEQNKKAFCVPASLLNSKGIGTNKMLKENKAKIVTEVEDIIKEFPEHNFQKKKDFMFIEIKNDKKAMSKKQTSFKSNNIKIEEENLEIYNCLKKEPKTTDEIVNELNKPITEVTYKLTLLELDGAIERTKGKKFKIR